MGWGAVTAADLGPQVLGACAAPVPPPGPSLAMGSAPLHMLLYLVVRQVALAQKVIGNKPGSVCACEWICVYVCVFVCKVTRK